jgi:ribonuclease P/MRP protein subunit POP3
VKPSKGKKAAKRQRKAAASDLVAEDTRQTSPLPPPDIAHHVDVGFNSITRNLETQHPSGGDGIKGGDRQYTMIFVARGDQSSTFNCHFPKMVAAASRDLPPNDRIRLVGLSKPCSDKLSKCLGIGRVSSIAITREAPGAGVLLEMVRSHVEPVDVSWLEADRNPQYLATSINAIETTVGPKRIRKDLKSSDEP